MKESKFLNEFKEFISKGNVIDMAVGVVVGGAFTAIVNSLVNDIIMPLVGLILGGLDFSGLSFGIKDAQINYGLFIQNVISFLIIAFALFCVDKAMNKFRSLGKKEDPKEEAPKEEAK